MYAEIYVPKFEKREKIMKRTKEEFISYFKK